MKDLSIQELGILKELVNRTWQEIAPDAMAIIGNRASRDNVFELVTDRLNDFVDNTEEKKLVGKFLSFSYKKMQELKEILLPMDFYE